MKEEAQGGPPNFDVGGTTRFLKCHRAIEGGAKQGSSGTYAQAARAAVCPPAKGSAIRLDLLPSRPTLTSSPYSARHRLVIPASVRKQHVFPIEYQQTSLGTPRYQKERK